MRNIFFIAVSFILLTSCNEKPCDLTSCRFKKGDDVEIKNKTFHDKATVTKVDCGCVYEVSYYSYLGVRRHRIVEEVELK